MFFKQPNKSSAFTLVEIIVVCAIVALLATVAYSSYDDSRKQARDKIRQSDLRQLQLALELYKDKYGRYPERGCSVTTANSWTGPGPGEWTSGFIECPEYIVGLVPEFLSKLPQDPNQEMIQSRGFYYQTNSNRSAYKVGVRGTVEALLLTSANDEFSRCPDATFTTCSAFTNPNHLLTSSYYVYSSGAEDW